MRTNMILKPWQVVGLSRLLEMRDRRQLDMSRLVRVAILADIMGPGRTYQAATFMLEVNIHVLHNPLSRPLS